MGSKGGTLGSVRATIQGNLARGALRPNESMDAIWRHLCEGLTALAEKKKSVPLATMPEEGLTQLLVDELERQPGYRPYYFQKGRMEDVTDGQSPKPDVTVNARDDIASFFQGINCIGGESFLALEAKRLPAPDSRREREYLVGNKLVQKRVAPKEDKPGKGEKGGVARFKLDIHGSKLKTVGMIGYVQRHAFDYWNKTINGWVDDLIATPAADLPWSEEEKLKLQTATATLARLRSSHPKHRSPRNSAIGSWC